MEKIGGWARAYNDKLKRREVPSFTSFPNPACNLMSSIKALDGIHGARVKPHSPYSLELFHRDGDLCQSDCQTSSIQTTQGFLMQRVWQQRPGCMRPCLSRAIRNENPKLLMAASALCLPFQPLLVSSVHTAMMEVAFAKRAVENPELKTAYNVHKLSFLLSGALFVADEVYPKTPFIHAAWHLTAAIGVGTCNKLLQ
ncbi:hypothetical protein V2J09_015095 [Rumex salicifolius]